MQTQTIINAYTKAIKTLELLNRVNEIIASAEKYAYSGSMFHPVVNYHIQTIERYRKVRDRLVRYYCFISRRACTMRVPQELTTITDNMGPF